MASPGRQMRAFATALGRLESYARVGLDSVFGARRGDSTALTA